MVDIDSILFRASSVGQLMGQKGLGKTGEKLARYNYLEYKYGRVKEFTNRYTEKGNNTEDASIEWLSKLDGQTYSKNEIRKSNEFFTGEPDIITDKKVIDVKNSWDIFTFSDACSEFNIDYEWQLRVYMDLFNLPFAELVYTLNDADEISVLKAIEKESYSYPEREIPEWREVQIIASMVFTQERFDYFVKIKGLGGDEFTDKLINRFVPIPEEERIIRYFFDADEDKINLAKNRVDSAREYLKKLYPCK